MLARSPELLEAADALGQSPLELAVRTVRERATRELLAAQADILRRDRDGARRAYRSQRAANMVFWISPNS